MHEDIQSKPKSLIKKFPLTMEGVRIVLKFSCLQTHSSSRYTFIYMELNVAHNERQFRDNLEGLQVLDLGLGWVLG